jgi:hypothetical protein
MAAIGDREEPDINDPPKSGFTLLPTKSWASTIENGWDPCYGESSAEERKPLLEQPQPKRQITGLRKLAYELLVLLSNVDVLPASRIWKTRRSRQSRD